MKCPKCNLTLSVPDPQPGEIPFPVKCPACDEGRLVVEQYVVTKEGKMFVERPNLAHAAKV